MRGMFSYQGVTMTIADELNRIAVAQGGKASDDGISGAIDALNDALAGKDEPRAQSIEGAIALLGEHIGGGGSSITVEALSVTENDVYTAPEGKAYSPVTVNVSGGASEYDIKCYTTNVDEELIPTADSFYPAISDNGSFVADTDSSIITKAQAGDVIAITNNTGIIIAVLSSSDVETANFYPIAEGTSLVMPSSDVHVVLQK